MDDDEELTGQTAFRDAILQARRESVEVLPPFAPVGPSPAAVVAAAAPVPRRRRVTYEYRVERTKGSRRRRAAALEALGRKGWDLVSVDGGYAYLRRSRADV